MDPHSVRRCKTPLASAFLGTVLRVTVVLAAIQPVQAKGRSLLQTASDKLTTPAGNTELPSPVLDLATAAAETWKSDQTILWSITGNYEPYEYTTTRSDIDGKNVSLPAGKPSGFAVDLAAAACAVCSLKCDFVLADTQDCWTSGGFPGNGLSAGHFDGCLAFMDTARRRLGVSFSDAIAKPRPAGILSRLGPETGGPLVSPDSDLSDKIVAVVGGWATNGRSLGDAVNTCTNITFNASPIDGYIVLTANDPFGGPDAAMRKLLDGDADVLFTYETIVDDRRGCTHVGCDASLYSGIGTEYAWIHTGLTGYQLNGTTLAMTKKGSPLVETINPCLRHVMRSAFYTQLCQEYRSRGFDDITELCFGGDDTNDEDVPVSEYELSDEFDDESSAPGPSPSASTEVWSGCAEGKCACEA